MWTHTMPQTEPNGAPTWPLHPSSLHPAPWNLENPCTGGVCFVNYFVPYVYHQSLNMLTVMNSLRQSFTFQENDCRATLPQPTSKAWQPLSIWSRETIRVQMVHYLQHTLLKLRNRLVELLAHEILVQQTAYMGNQSFMQIQVTKFTHKPFCGVTDAPNPTSETSVFQGDGKRSVESLCRRRNHVRSLVMHDCTWYSGPLVLSLHLQQNLWQNVADELAEIFLNGRWQSNTSKSGTR
jgi:hypothetical protein